MKYIATVTQVLEYQVPIHARSKGEALSLLDEMDEDDFIYQDVIDYDVKLEEVDE